MIDAHLHLWKRSPGRYPWLEGPGLSGLRRNWTPKDAAKAIAQTSVAETVLVQAEGTVDDTDDMLNAASLWSAVRGVVGWLPLEDPAALDLALTRWSDTLLLVGARHLNHNEPDPAWLSRPGVITSLRQIARQSLAFDVVAVTERHLIDAATIAESIPDLTVIIDHLGSPSFTSADWDAWLRAMIRLAKSPNVYLKVSGLGTLAGKKYNSRNLSPLLEVTAQIFGSQRMMFGSDWPVSTLVYDYRSTLTVIEEAVASWSFSEKEHLFRDSAERAYRLRDS